MPLPEVAQLRSALEASDVGRELLRGLAVVPSTGAERTDTSGVADFEWNAWLDSGVLRLQIFDGTAWQSWPFTHPDLTLSGDLTYPVPHIECYISSSSATTISNTSDFFQVAGTFTNSVVGVGFSVAAGGQITYTATRTRMLHVYSSWGFHEGSTNQDMEVGIRKNGTIITASIITRRLAVTNDVGSSALHAMFTVATGDTFDSAVRNTTGSNDVTFDKLNLGVMALPNDMTGITIP